MLPGCSCTKPARLSSAVAIPGVLLPALASAAGQLEDAALLFRSNTLASPASILTSRWQPNRSHNKQCWCVGPPHTLQQLAGRGRHPAPCYFGCMGLHGVQASMGFCMGLHGVARRSWANCSWARHCVCPDRRRDAGAAVSQCARSSSWTTGTTRVKRPAPLFTHGRPRWQS